MARFTDQRRWMEQICQLVWTVKWCRVTNVSITKLTHVLLRLMSCSVCDALLPFSVLWTFSVDTLLWLTDFRWSDVGSYGLVDAFSSLHLHIRISQRDALCRWKVRCHTFRHFPPVSFIRISNRPLCRFPLGAQTGVTNKSSFYLALHSTLVVTFPPLTESRQSRSIKLSWQVHTLWKLA